MIEVQCVETGEIFSSMREAARKFSDSGNGQLVAKAIRRSGKFGGYTFVRTDGKEMAPKKDKCPESLCFNCDNTTINKCSLFNPYDMRLPKGTEAIVSERKFSTKKAAKYYLVTKCPHFVQWEGRKKKNV